MALFPEGTTTDGSHVHAFHAALLQPAIEAGAPIQPLALAYRLPDGRFTRAPAYDGDDRHRILVANCVAQAAALALGREPADGDLHRAFPGDRPSTLFTLPRLDARSLGALLACWEHATFTAAVVLGINPFDQFGVEYGKVMASSVESLLAGSDVEGIDAATRASVARLR